jgi:hypothetical protein
MAKRKHITKHRVIPDKAMVPLMLQLQLARAVQELHKLCRLPSTSMTEVRLLNTHLEEATVALDLGKYREVQHCLKVFYRATREDTK